MKFSLKLVFWAFILAFEIDHYKLGWGILGIFFLLVGSIFPATCFHHPLAFLSGVMASILAYLAVGLAAHFSFRVFRGSGFLTSK